MVATAVTIEMEAVLIPRHAALGGELIRIAIRDARRLFSGRRPAMPVTQWAWTKP